MDVPGAPDHVMIRGINRTLPSSAQIAGGGNRFVGLTFERSEENVVPTRKVSIDSAGRSTASVEDLHVDIIVATVLYLSLIRCNTVRH
jgi:hypothetical protein